MPSLRNQAQGFTLVELLIVVAIIGILAAIAVPNLISAIQRGRQKRTMGDLKTVASALEQYNTDNNGYIPLSFGPVGSATVLYSSATNATNALNPAYLVNPIYKDGWWSTSNTAAVFYYFSTTGQAYALCSHGKNTSTMDGPVGCQASAESSTATLDGTTFNCDIVIQNGQFIQAPLGKQTHRIGC